jgi:nucleoid DNA-binding protein
MTKKEFVKAIAEKTGLTQAKVSDVLKVMGEVIVETVKKGDTVRLSDLGTFKLKEVSERKGRNPKTGEEIMIPAHKKMVFQVSKKYKKM